MTVVTKMFEDKVNTLTTIFVKDNLKGLENAFLKISTFGAFWRYHVSKK